ncbi:hypothetical protein CLF_111789 [Clonorchis sinensis]|uniref:Uncharacterized protein n=1 Tax=Clonorchis sinensis TaxID=79923 RepID=G7YVC2_CLOSI|nr:hypothetical protein CLF_111789 [Clonorchis sinensis]
MQLYKDVKHPQHVPSSSTIRLLISDLWRPIHAAKTGRCPRHPANQPHCSSLNTRLMTKVHPAGSGVLVVACSIRGHSYHHTSFPGNLELIFHGYAASTSLLLCLYHDKYPSTSCDLHNENLNRTKRLRFSVIFIKLLTAVKHQTTTAASIYRPSEPAGASGELREANERVLRLLCLGLRPPCVIEQHISSEACMHMCRARNFVVDPPVCGNHPGVVAKYVIFKLWKHQRTVILRRQVFTTISVDGKQKQST